MDPAFQLFPARVRAMRNDVEALSGYAGEAMDERLRTLSNRFDKASRSLSPMQLAARVSRNDRRLALIEQRIASAAAELTDQRNRGLATAVTRLDALSPLAVLTRGYSITQNSSGEIVRNVHQTEVGERIKVRVADGRIAAEVKEIVED
jgi:exodeoxyribonuclease VII large subunit